MSAEPRTPDGSLVIVDVTEARERPVDHVSALARLLADAKIELELLEEMEDVLGWEDAAVRLRFGQPSVRKGEFGEVLVTAVLEEFDGLVVPIRKLRYQIDPEQTLPGNDVVAFDVGDDGALDRVVFVECKLRTRRDLPAGTDAHTQLVEDRDKGFADIIGFVYARMREAAHPLLPAFRDYLRSRSREERGEYAIGLIWDSDTWAEAVIERVSDLPDRLDPLSASIVRFNGLQALAEAVFAEAELALADDEP